MSPDGKRSGGTPFFRGALYRILQNPLYVGDVPHRGAIYPGEQEALVSRDMWEEVQRTLKENTARQDCGEGVQSPSLLVGCVEDEHGVRMIPSHTLRRNRRYRYYVSAPSSDPAEGPTKGGLRIPAHDLEEGVWGRLRTFLSSPSELLSAMGTALGRQAQVIQAAAQAIQAWEVGSTLSRRAWLKNLLHKVVVSPTTLTLEVDLPTLWSRLGFGEGTLENGDAEPTLILESESRLKRGGRGLRFVIPGAEGDWGEAHLDRPLIQAVARGRHWYHLLLSGQAKSREEIGERHGFCGQHVARILPLAWLAPDIVEAILEGRQPKELTVKRLLGKFSMDWAEQRRVLGFESRSKSA